MKCPRRTLRNAGISVLRSFDRPADRTEVRPGEAAQEVVRTGPVDGPPWLVGHPMFTVRRPIRVEQPELLIPKIEPPSDALANPHWVSSRNEPNFSSVGF